MSAKMAHTSDVATTSPSPPKEVQPTQSWDLSGRGTTRAEHAPGIPTQSHTSPSVLVAAECTFTRLLDPRRAHPSLLYRPGAKSWNKCQILPKRFLWEQILVIRQLCACLPKRVPWHRATAGRILVMRQLGVCLIARMRPGVVQGAASGTDRVSPLSRKVDIRLPGKGKSTPMARGRSTS